MPATIGETDRAARNLFGAMLTLCGGQAFPEDVAADVNRLIRKWAYEGGLSASQIGGMRERMTDSLAETVAFMGDDDQGEIAGNQRGPLDDVAEIVALGKKITATVASINETLDKDAADKREIAGNLRLINDIIDAGNNPMEMPVPPRLPLAILGNGGYASVIDETAVRG
jgi:hypothetical protein